ncbi:MAG: hypothetical protein H7Y11_09670 [Armatimonadetes bacterium]|nr:hypothetical protein [Anaerolineae bacterium]
MNQRRETARKLREHGMLVTDIATMVKASTRSVSLWVSDIVLTDDQVEVLKTTNSRLAGQHKGAEINRAKFKAQREVYQQAGRERAKQGDSLHRTGCMLYWAEGAKRRGSMIFVNSDKDMLLLFMQFLREAMNITNDSICIHIHCHTNEPIKMAWIERHWLDTLQLPDNALRKTMVKKVSTSRNNILEYGVCGITVNNVAVIQHIYGAIQEYGGFDRPEWLA